MSTNNLTIFSVIWEDAVVSVTMKRSEFEVDRGKLFVGYFDSDGVSSAIQFGFNLEALLRRSIRN